VEDGALGGEYAAHFQEFYATSSPTRRIGCPIQQPGFARRVPRAPSLLVAFPGGPTDITMRSLADNASKSSASR
jgi:hypothetical protein